MQAIGDRLREARMRQKIDIAEVEAATKIRAKYLRALENEEFGLLPGSTFVKSFLRTYAEYLGLDPTLLVEEYRAQHEPREQAELQPFSAPPRGRERRAPAGPPRPALLVVGVIVLILAGLWALGQASDEGGDDDGGGSAQEERSGNDDEGRDDRERRREEQRNAAAEGVRLRVVPNSGTYVCVDNGRGTVEFEGTLSAPQSFGGRDVRRVRINIGRRDVELRHNGRQVPIEPGPEPIAFDFRRGERRRELPTAQAPCA